MSGKVKLIKISSMYPGYLRALYAAHPGAEDWSYAEQYRLVMGGAGGWADFWKTYLESLGRFEVEEVVINADSLQRAWMKERGLPVRAGNEREQVVARQVQAFGPDVLFPHDFHFFSPAFLARLRKDNPTITRTIFYDGVAYCDAAHFAGADLILSCGDFILDYYRAQGFRTALFKLGFESSLLRDPELHGQKREGAVFTGSVSLRPYAHLGRLLVLDKLAGDARFQVRGQIPTPRDLRVHAVKLLLERKWGSLLRYPADWRRFQRVRGVNRGPVYGRDMYAVLAQALVCVNIHIDVAGNNAGNSRLFEATGIGCCLLTDDKQNLREFFEPDREVVTFQSLEECVEKFKYLMENPQVAEAIGLAGQRRTLRDYSLGEEIRQVGQDLLEIMA
jgi:spore maturation protein CgeB